MVVSWSVFSGASAGSGLATNPSAAAATASSASAAVYGAGTRAGVASVRRRLMPPRGFGVVASGRDKPAGLAFGDFVPGGPMPFGNKVKAAPPDADRILATNAETGAWWFGMLAGRLEALMQVGAVAVVVAVAVGVSVVCGPWFWVSAVCVVSVVCGYCCRWLWVSVVCRLWSASVLCAFVPCAVGRCAVFGVVVVGSRDGDSSPGTFERG